MRWGTRPWEPVGSSHSLMAAGEVREIEDEPTLVGHSSSAAVSGHCSHALAGPKGWRGQFHRTAARHCGAVVIVVPGTSTTANCWSCCFN